MHGRPLSAFSLVASPEDLEVSRQTRQDLGDLRQGEMKVDQMSEEGPWAGSTTDEGAPLVSIGMLFMFPCSILSTDDARLFNLPGIWREVVAGRRVGQLGVDGVVG